MSGATVVQVPGPGDAVRDVRISSPDRVMWPEAGVTKLRPGPATPWPWPTGCCARSATGR